MNRFGQGYDLGTVGAPSYEPLQTSSYPAGRDAYRAERKSGGAHASPLRVARQTWKDLPPPARLAVAIGAMLVGALVLKLIVRDPDLLFFLAEAIHGLGLSILVWKINVKQSVAGLSLKMQWTTLIFLATRLICSLCMEVRWTSGLFFANNLHAVFDLTCLVCTAWVIYEMKGPLSATYKANESLDSMPMPFLILPALVLALTVYPPGRFSTTLRMLWAFSLYVESVSNIPQILMFHKSNVVERFAGHYLFCLAISRYLCLAHWLLQLVDRNGELLSALGQGPWAWLVAVAEIVQTFIMADFVYLYVTSYARGLPTVQLGNGGVV